MLKIFILAIALYTTASAQPNIVGPIGSFEWEPKLVGESTVVVFIDSPGGRVDKMWDIIKQMHDLQANGVTIKCHVIGMAASVAFVILTQCDERIAYAGLSALMWHEVAVIFPGGYKLPLSDAKALYTQLQISHDRMMAAMCVDGKGFCADAEAFERYWKDEVFFNAETANHLSPGFFKEVRDATK